MTIALSIALGAAVLGCAWLYVERRRLTRERDAARRELADANAQVDAMREELIQLRERIAAAHDKQQQAEQMLQKVDAQLKETFKASASDVMASTNKQFLTLAEERFKPLRELLDKYHLSLSQLERSRAGAYAELKQQIEYMRTDQQYLRTETANLVKALRRPEVRGRWGELQMHRLFELAGMTEHVDYDEQASVDSGEGRSVRPDFTIRLPNERVIVIDVKTPIDAYLNATEATDDAERERQLDRHTQQVRSAADNLAGKAYWAAIDGSPEFVVLFVPGESMLYAAVQRDPDLIERAMQKNVIVATPTTVMALLKTVAMGWRERALTDSAHRIAELGRELHERLAIAIENISKLGSRIDSAVKQYNTLVGSVESRLVPSARKFEDLHAESAKQIPPTIPTVETAVRESSLALGSHSEDTSS